MATPNVFFVHLRRPRANDQRDDPFYEFGSFGCTGCHSSNLLHKRHVSRLEEGARLTFIQGGPDGSRLVFLTPLISVKEWPDSRRPPTVLCEVNWTPAEMPLKYDKAPILVLNQAKAG